jgi:hypothetical protein
MVAGQCQKPGTMHHHVALDGDLQIGTSVLRVRERQTVVWHHPGEDLSWG